MMNGLRSSRKIAYGAGFALLAATSALAGGPRYVAGATFFDSAVAGHPIIWAGGQVHYFVDQGPLGLSLSNAQAVALVDSAASVWNSLPTAAVNVQDSGFLEEDVNGENVVVGSGTFLAPSDITPSSITTPVAVIFDSDGTIIDSIEGQGASDPTDCRSNSLITWIDNFNTNGTFAHGVIILNGRCATSAALQSMMTYQLERAFGTILGLDFSQVNDDALNQTILEPGATAAWPIMQPVNKLCGSAGGDCILNPGQLHYDDMAALNRLYPVTTGNIGSFSGKELTAANTVSIVGTLTFRGGVGMQGVNVVVRPLDSNGNLLYQYTTTFVSGAYFCGNHGNPITGWKDQFGNRLDRFGGNDVSLQGFFDLSGIPLPPNYSSASFQISFEPVNPQYVEAISVGPYTLGSPSPSGTLPTILVESLGAGSTQRVTVEIPDSAFGENEVANPVGPEPVSSSPYRPVGHLSGLRATRSDSIGFSQLVSTDESEPPRLPASGFWSGRIGDIGESDWYVFSVLDNRIFTVITQALDESGSPAYTKAMPVVGLWDGTSPTATPPVVYSTAFDGVAAGETWLRVSNSGDAVLRLGVSDQRGDGRPDYTYRGWVLYANSIIPNRLPASGGQISIVGTGFRAGDSVLVGGVHVKVLGILPNLITASVPPTASGTLGAQDVEVDDLAGFNAAAIIPGGLILDSGATDSLKVVSGPSGAVPMNVPQPLAVIVSDSGGNPLGNVAVNFTLSQGAADLGCGAVACTVLTMGNGIASLSITPISTSIATVTASLNGGASTQSSFVGVEPPSLISLTPALHVANGSIVQWPMSVLVQLNGLPSQGVTVNWQSSPGILASASSSVSDASGVASMIFVVGPLAAGNTAPAAACINSTATCVSFLATSSPTTAANLIPLSGTDQILQVGSSPSPISLEALDANGNILAGAPVTIYQELRAWVPDCSRGPCVSQTLLSSATTSTSGVDGIVTVLPLTISGLATTLNGLAFIGLSGELSFSVDTHP